MQYSNTHHHHLPTPPHCLLFFSSPEKWATELKGVSLYQGEM